MIRAVYFDVDDTLYDQLLPFKAAFKKAFPNIVITNNSCYERIFKIFRTCSDSIFPKYEEKQVSVEEMWIKRMSDTLNNIRESDIDSRRILNFQRIYNDELEHIKPFSQIPQLISSLKAINVSVGIISNGGHKHQIDKIVSLGLENDFLQKNILISGDYSFSKPDRRIFEKALGDEQIESNCTLYVGDNFYSDVYGAKTAGLRTVWFNHRNRHPRFEVKPDLIINSPQELSKIYSYFFKGEHN